MIILLFFMNLMDIQSTQSKHDDSICNPARLPKLVSKKLMMIQMIYSSWDFPSQATPCKYKIQSRATIIQNFRNSREKSVRAEQYDSYAIIEYGTSGTVILNWLLVDIEFRCESLNNIQSCQLEFRCLFQWSSSFWWYCKQSIFQRWNETNYR